MTGAPRSRIRERLALWVAPWLAERWDTVPADHSRCIRVLTPDEADELERRGRAFLDEIPDIDLTHEELAQAEIADWQEKLGRDDV